jgi:predicted alpha/beta-fold hydrolase
MYPALLRKVSGVVYDRERIQTPDDDFLDLDWLRQGAERVVIISHGLEGNTSRAYMKGNGTSFLQSKLRCAHLEFPRMQRRSEQAASFLS